MFSNILSMLSIFELGIGSAIIYNLYKPVAENDKEKIKSLMLFYRKSYHTIAIIIFLIGICLIPFLPSIVGETSITESITLIFFLFILDTTFSYLLSYKRSILYANEKNYIINILHIVYVIFLNALQILILISTKNYIMYLLLKIAFKVLENIIITFIANIQYPYITEHNVKNIDKDMQKNIFQNVRGLLFHKIGTFVVLGTDNIIISKFLGVTVLGLYANYNMIITALNQVMSQIYEAITASVGNLLVENDSVKSYDTYRKLSFFNYIISSFCSIVFCCLVNPFIEIWIGSEYLIELNVIIVLSINFYFQSMRKTISVFKEAAGVFYKDRYIPLIESSVNIVASVIFVKLLGLKGVFIGTIISTLILYLYSYPKYVYEPIFNKDKMKFFKEIFCYLMVFFIESFITIFITINITNSNVILQFILKLFISSILVIIMDILIFKKCDEYRYFKKLFLVSFFNKITKK